MQALIVGGDSKLGLALAREFAWISVWLDWTTRRSPVVPPAIELDLRNPLLPPVEKSIASGSRVLFIVAAITGVVQCETDPDAWRVNADAPILLTRQAHPRAWTVVFVSSDAVERAPHTAYAMQKAHAEAGVLALGGIVVRPARMSQPEDYAEVARLMISVGEHGSSTGVERWVGRS